MTDIAYANTYYGKPVFEINGRAEEVWTEDMGNREDYNTRGGVSMDSLWHSEVYLWVEDTETEDRWFWSIDLSTGNLRYHTKKTGMRRR